jgi:hypothetical protein
MKKLILLPFLILFATPASADEMIYINVNRVCATIVGIPYASDNFTDAEWKKFQNCVHFMRKFDGVN